MASKKGVTTRSKGQESEAPEAPTQAPTAAVGPPAPIQQQTGSPTNSPPETQQMIVEFMQLMRNQQEDFMTQMALRQEQMALENMREREAQREILQQHQRLVVERTTPTRDGQALRMDPEETPANLALQLDGANIRNHNNRRDSASHRLTTFNGGMNREGMLTVESDKHTSIIWENRSIDGFLKFLDDIDKFILTYNQPVPHLFTHINENLQEVLSELLYVHKPNKYTSMTDIFKATTADIIEMVQIYFAPRDLAHFNTLLTSSCKKYEVTQRGDFYAPTRLKLYGLKKKFKDRFDFLVAGATKTGRKESIPAINYKQGGVLNIWTDLTPEGSRESFKQMLINARYDTLDDFLDKYMAKVDETNNLSENIKVYKYRIGGASNYERGQEKRSKDNERLYHMQDEDMGGKEDVYEDEEELFAMGSNVKEDYSQEACPKLLTKGQCWQRDCRYSHKARTIEQEREKLLQKWSGAQKKLTAEARDQKTMMEKKQQPLEAPMGLRNAQRNATADVTKSWRKIFDPKSHKRVPDVRIMEEAEADIPDQQPEQTSDSEDSEFALISAFLKVEGSKQHNVAKRPATARVKGGGEQIEVKAALFDTGASSSNYVSDNWINSNNLQRHLLPANRSVKVANGETCTINHRITLEISFKHRDGSPTTAMLDFLVLEGLNMDLVVGLPTICGCFKELFIEMIEESTIECTNDNIADIRNIQPAILKQKPVNLCWTAPLCEEEKMIPEPASFQNIFFLEASYEDSLKQFLEDLPSRIDPEFNRTTEVFQYLSREAVDVFVPRSWDGIAGVEVELDFDPAMPSRIRPAPRKIPAAVADAAKKEFDRMCGYMYRPSTSPISSPLVVAPKATAPYVRLCGDYRVINRFVLMFNYPIPDPKTELHRVAMFSVYIDLDMKNAFHGIKLKWLTSRILSVQTPYGQFEPIFLPEGVSPASLILMAIMYDIFVDYMEWMIVIFDNMLILAHNYEDAFQKLVKVIERCKEKNIILKLSKSRFGVKEVEFFGYVCSGGAYSLSQGRINEVTAIPFPSGGNKVRKMQQFLGAAMYFRPFIYQFSEKSTKLHQMTHKDFNWDKSKWTEDYEAIFNSFKDDIAHSFTLYHPDYGLPWFLYVDASDEAVGGVLIQLVNETEQQVIAFVSKKFTPTAKRWSTIEKECFAMFYSVQKLQYYLFMKKFTLLTDHNNLLWMESSHVPKIVRMRIYLQNFSFDLIHVKGKENVFADWLSRMYPEDDAAVDMDMLRLCFSMEDSPEDRADGGVDATIAKVHNSRMGHHGVQRTWLLLNKHVPGHGIPIRIVQDYVSRCVWCQKVRNTLASTLAGPIRAIVPEHTRHMCGYDTLYVEKDKLGRQYLHVFKFIPSRLVFLYPAETLTAENLATAMFVCFTTYGVTDILITDPGSNIDSQTVDVLMRWMGIRLRMSLVGRHQSNMVERSHRETLRFLSTLVNEERIRDRWSEPHVLATIQFLLNSEASHETSLSPFEYTFGSEDRQYFRLPEVMENKDLADKYVQTLNDNLRLIREVAKGVQESFQKGRKESNPNAGVNSYLVGDMVLVNEEGLDNRKGKLSCKFSGPYIITSTHKADISCKHIVTGKVRTVHMEHLKPYFGSKEEAYKAALTDDNQYVIRMIHTYMGDPELRSEMKFRVEFEDGDIRWLPFNQDLATSAPFVAFCSSKPELEPLTHTVEEWRKQKKVINAEGVQGVEPGDTCYVDLRAWGWGYLENTGLPDILDNIYVVPCKYVKWTSQKKLKIDVKCELFDQLFEWAAVDVNAYGRQLAVTDNMILVDQELCRTYPKILE